MNSEERYEERWIGKGAYGNVYEIVGQSPPQVVKYMYWTEENQKEDFQKESEILGKLDHPNIVKFIGSKENIQERKFGIIMEYCTEGTLKDVIFAPKIIYSMKTVICWAEQLFDALSYMFKEHQVIHRDIKPANIFVTKDFNLKIGDFGFVKLSENTCPGTFVGTLTYMSPPQIEEARNQEENVNADLQASHRNDVYSLGLVLWEIIERRSIFSPYRIGTAFDRDWFVMEIVSKRITELEPPNCQKKLQKIIVEKCSNFNRELRSVADEILKSIKEFKENHMTDEKLKFPPITNVEQRELIRPIGFNGKMDWIGVDVAGFGVDHEEFTQSISSREIFFYGHDYDSIIQQNLLEGWKNLNESEKNSFLQIISQIVAKEEEKKYLFEKHLEVKELIEKTCSTLSPVNNLEEFQKLFELFILNDYFMQCELFGAIFQFIGNYQKYSFYFPWSLYQQIKGFQEQLEKCKKTRYNKEIHFECFISIPTKEEWIFAGDFTIKDAKRSLFIRKDSLTVKHFVEGNRINNKYFDCKSINKSSKEFNYSHLESIDLSTMIVAVKKHVMSMKRTTELAISKQTHIEDSRRNLVHPRFKKANPFFCQNYIFQLRNPLRYSCGHKEECEFVGFEPYKMTYEKLNWEHDSYFSEMKIDIYDCTPKKSKDELEFYFCFHPLFHFLLTQDLDMGRKWRNAVSIAFSQQDASLLFLNCPNMSSDIKTQKYNFLILLDHPNNYHPKEKVPCFTLENWKLFISESIDFEIYEVEAETLTRYFEANKDFPHKYTLIDHRFRAKILDKNGEPMTDWFDLLDASNWPEPVMISENAYRM